MSLGWVINIHYVTSSGRVMLLFYWGIFIRLLSCLDFLLLKVYSIFSVKIRSEDNRPIYNIHPIYVYTTLLFHRRLQPPMTTRPLYLPLRGMVLRHVIALNHVTKFRHRNGASTSATRLKTVWVAWTTAMISTRWWKYDGPKLSWQWLTWVVTVTSTNTGSTSGTLYPSLYSTLCQSYNS